MHPLSSTSSFRLCGARNARERDLLSIWAGSVIASEPAYPAWHYALALYGGVILSDLITFNLGRLTQRGLGKRIQEAVFKDPVKVEKAMARIRKHGDSIGFVSALALGRVFH